MAFSRPLSAGPQPLTQSKSVISNSNQDPNPPGCIIKNACSLNGIRWLIIATQPAELQQSQSRGYTIPYPLMAEPRCNKPFRLSLLMHWRTHHIITSAYDVRACGNLKASHLLFCTCCSGSSEVPQCHHSNQQLMRCNECFSLK